MSNRYKCNLCEREFEHRTTYKNHVNVCGTEDLTNYDFKQFNTQFKRIEALNKKIESNKNDIKDRKVTQRNLRNHAVRQQKLKNF